MAVATADFCRKPPPARPVAARCAPRARFARLTVASPGRAGGPFQSRPIAGPVERSRVVVPAGRSAPTPPRAGAGSVRPARCARGLTRGGARALPVSGTSRPSDPRAGSAWPSAREASATRGRAGALRASTNHLLAESKGERSRPGPDEASTAAERGAQRVPASREREGFVAVSVAGVAITAREREGFVFGSTVAVMRVHEGSVAVLMLGVVLTDTHLKD
jgi:hypothetical protein